MAKELIQLGQSRRPDQHSESIPQLALNGRAISLKKLHSDPQSIFDRLRYRICELPFSKQKVPDFCNSTYRHDVEAMVCEMTTTGRHYRVVPINSYLDEDDERTRLPK